jgi:hypothetical protein
LGSRPRLVYYLQAQNPVGPYAAGPYREHRHRATCWKNGTGPTTAGKINPQILPFPHLPPFGASTIGDDAHLSRSPSPPPAKQKSSLAHRRLARFPLPSTMCTSDPLTGDAPPNPQGVWPFASPAAMDSDDELMIEVLQEDEAKAAAQLQR